jgi:glutamate racemase
LFVPLAEEGWVDNDIARQTAALYLASLRQSRIDALVLGCTHYPLLAGVIGEYLGAGVQLIDSATETAREVKALLAERGLAHTGGPGSASFFVTDVADRFVRVGGRFLGSAIDSAVRIER